MTVRHKFNPYYSILNQVPVYSDFVQQHPFLQLRAITRILFSSCYLFHAILFLFLSLLLLLLKLPVTFRGRIFLRLTSLPTGLFAYSLRKLVNFFLEQSCHTNLHKVLAKRIHKQL